MDDLWFARQGASVLGLDYALRGSEAVAGLAAAEGVDLEFRGMNLCELRSVLAEGARVAHLEGPKVVTVRNVAEATDRVGRGHLWRACEMMLREGGRLYLEVLVGRAASDGFAREQHLRPLALPRVVAELEARGAHVVARRQAWVSSPGRRAGHRIGRLVVQWQR